MFFLATLQNVKTIPGLDQKHLAKNLTSFVGKFDYTAATSELE